MALPPQLSLTLDPAPELSMPPIQLHYELSQDTGPTWKKKKNKKNAAQQLYWSTREASTERDRKGWWRKERQEQMEQSRLLQCPCTHQVLTRKPVGSVKEAPLTSVGSG